MSIAETKQYTKTEKLTCPRDGCGGHVTVIALSAGWYKECDCGHRWDFTDAAGRPITKEQYEERAVALARRQNISQLGELDLQEARCRMTTKKTAEKSSKGKSTKAPAQDKKAKAIERVYKGETFTVTPTAGGFEIGGKVFRSLTSVAKAITGAKAISGPRFFRLV
jgi:hypothetical protein